MIRTIETALTTFRDVMKFSMEKPATKIEAWDALRGMEIYIFHCFRNLTNCRFIEWGSIPCCTGTSVAKLREKFGQQVDFGLIKPDWEFNRELHGDKSRAAKVKESLFKIARNVQELTRRGLISDVRDGDSSTRGPYYVPYEIAIVSHGGFLETMLEAELGGSKFSFYISKLNPCSMKQKLVIFRSLNGHICSVLASTINQITLNCPVLTPRRRTNLS